MWFFDGLSSLGFGGKSRGGEARFVVESSVSGTATASLSPSTLHQWWRDDVGGYGVTSGHSVLLHAFKKRGCGLGDGGCRSWG